MISKLSGLIERVFGEDFTEVVEMADFRETDIWDSLMYVNLVVSLEKAFKIELEKDEIQMLTSVENIEAVLAKRGIDANS
jgi:acyl carrier protein